MASSHSVGPQSKAAAAGRTAESGQGACRGAAEAILDVVSNCVADRLYTDSPRARPRAGRGIRECCLEAHTCGPGVGARRVIAGQCLEILIQPSFDIAAFAVLMLAIAAQKNEGRRGLLFPHNVCIRSLTPGAAIWDVPRPKNPGFSIVKLASIKVAWSRLNHRRSPVASTSNQSSQTVEMHRCRTTRNPVG